MFTEINLHYRVIGRDLKVKSVERAVALSKDTYCSVSRMLEASVKITTSVNVLSRSDTQKHANCEDITYYAN